MAKPKDAAARTAAIPEPGESSFRRGMSATMQDVATAAGVSVITVSRFFRMPDSVRPKTQKRIREAIKDTGYLPNLTARSLASKRSNVVAVVVPAIDNPIYSEMVRGLSDEFRRKDISIIIGNTEHKYESEQDTVRALMAHRPDGIVLTGIQRSDAVRTMLAVSDIPVVETWETGPECLDMTVGFDNSAAMRGVGQHLVERGYRRLVVVSGEIAKYSRLQKRLDGLRDAIAGTGAEICDPVIELPAHARSGAEAVRRLRETGLQPDAMVCFGDVYAVGAVLECVQAGIGVPRDLAITGFGDFEHASMLSPALTTVRVPGREIGEKAAKLLWRKMTGRKIASAHVDVGFELIPRQSS